MSNDPNTWCPPRPDPKQQQDTRQTNVWVPGSVCHLGWRPFLITGLLRELAIRHFSHPDLIETPDLKNAIWQEQASTGILIESVYRFRVDTLEKRPAILIKRNAYQNIRILLNDKIGVDVQGNDSYATMWVGSHTLFCLHGTGASTELLASEVQRDIHQFAPAVRKALNLVKYQVMEVGAISILEEAKQNYVIPIDVAWAYEEVWKLAPQALPLAKVDYATGY